VNIFNVRKNREISGVQKFPIQAVKALHRKAIEWPKTAERLMSTVSFT